MVNGVANNIYKNSPQTNNLGAITEENVNNSQNSSVKNRSTPVQQGSSLREKQDIKESINSVKGKQFVDERSNGLPASAESRSKSGTPSAVVRPSGEKNQSKNNKPVTTTTSQVQKGDHAVDKTPPTQVLNKTENGPKFSINSDDSGDESPPKGKFYI
jgi:hypothetical protein